MSRLEPLPRGRKRAARPAPRPVPGVLPPTTPAPLPPMQWAHTLPSGNATEHVVPPLGVERIPIDVPNPGLYRKDRGFMDFGSPKYDQGWKLHVPIPEDRDVGSIQPMFLYLQNNKIPHKYTKEYATLAEMEGGQQRGKFLTVYPSGTEELLRTLEALEVIQAGAEYDHPRLAPSDRPVGDGAITARYGGLTSKYVLKPVAVDKARRDNVAPMELGDYQLDNRGVYKPDHIKDPFPCGEKFGGQEEGWYQFPVEFRERRDGTPYATRPKELDDRYVAGELRFLVTRNDIENPLQPAASADLPPAGVRQSA